MAVGGERHRTDLALDVPATPVDRLEHHRVGQSARQGVAQRCAQLVDRQADVEAEQMLADHLVRPQPPQLAGLAVPYADHLLLVEDGDADAEADEDGLQRRVDVVELHAALAQLVVHRLELLVGRLELLVHRLELLVGRLELLVGGLELLVGRLELLVGGLELLHRRLKLLVGLLELSSAAFDLGLQPVGFGDVDESDGRAQVFLPRPYQRSEPDVEDPVLALVRAPRHVADADRMAALGHVIEMRAQLDRPVGQLQVLDRLADVADAQPEEPARIGVRSGQEALRVEDHLGAGGPVIGLLAQGVAPRGRARPGLAEHPQALARVRLGHLAKDAPLQIDGREQVAMGEEHLGLPEHEDALGLKREVQAAEDLRLRLGVEVHQRVAADQEIDAGDRRVDGEVVATEDDVPPQVLAEVVVLIVTLEVALEQIVGNGLDLLAHIARGAGLFERVIVDVGGVDLDPLPEPVFAHRLGEEDRGGVGLLARGAARTPDPERAVVAVLGDQLGKYRLGQVRPVLRVAEEPGDVDQDGVEEDGELLGMELQVLDVADVAVDSHLLHALAYPALERRALVSREVEAAVVLEKLEEHVELAALGLRATHADSSRRSAPFSSSRWAGSGSPSPVDSAKARSAARTVSAWRVASSAWLVNRRAERIC